MPHLNSPAAARLTTPAGFVVWGACLPFPWLGFIPQFSTRWLTVLASDALLTCRYTSDVAWIAARDRLAQQDDLVSALGPGQQRIGFEELETLEHLPTEPAMAVVYRPKRTAQRLSWRFDVVDPAREMFDSLRARLAPNKEIEMLPAELEEIRPNPTLVICLAALLALGICGLLAQERPDPRLMRRPLVIAMLAVGQIVGPTLGWGLLFGSIAGIFAWVLWLWWTLPLKHVVRIKNVERTWFEFLSK